jgi:hypothetical protein
MEINEKTLSHHPNALILGLNHKMASIRLVDGNIFLWTHTAKNYRK